MKRNAIIQALATLIIISIGFQIQADQLVKLGNMEEFKYSHLTSWCVYMSFVGITLTRINFLMFLHEQKHKICKAPTQND